MNKKEDWGDSLSYDLDELLGPPPRSIKKKWKEENELQKFMRRKAKQAGYEKY